MVQLRVKELLKERDMTKYKLHQQMQMITGISYGNFNNMIENKTTSIKYSNIELLSNILQCDIGELFEKIDETSEVSA